VEGVGFQDFVGALVVGAVALVVDGLEVVAVVDRGEGLEGGVPLGKEAVTTNLVVEAEEGVYFAGGEDVSGGYEGVWGLLGEGEVNLPGEKLIGIAVEPCMAQEEELLGERVVEEGVGSGGEGGPEDGSLADDVEVRGNEVGKVALEERRILVCKEESGDVVFEGEGVGVPESAVGDAPASTFSAFIADVAGSKARIGFLVVEGELGSQDKLGGSPMYIGVEGEEAILAVPVATRSGEGFGLGGVVEGKGPGEDSEAAVGFVEEGVRKSHVGRTF
jgi:hypothetical protein